jgi:hypothetical protein
VVRVTLEPIEFCERLGVDIVDLAVNGSITGPDHCRICTEIMDAELGSRARGSNEPRP